MSDELNDERQTEGRDEADEMARLQEQINNLPVSEHLLYMMHSLSSLAIDRLGLVPESASRKDADQARLAIDAFKALLGVLEQARPTEEVAAHRGMLSQLQMAYVGALGSPAPSGEAADTADATEKAPVAEQAAPEPAPAKEPEPEPEKKAAPKKAAPKKTVKSGSSAKTGAKTGTKSGGAKGAAGKGASKGAAKGGKKSS